MISHWMMAIGLPLVTGGFFLIRFFGVDDYVKNADAAALLAGGTMIAAGAFGAAPAEQWQSHGVGIIMQGVGLGFLDVIAVWESGPREEALQALPAEAPASGRTPGTLR